LLTYCIATSLPDVFKAKRSLIVHVYQLPAHIDLSGFEILFIKVCLTHVHIFYLHLWSRVPRCFMFK